MSHRNASLHAVVRLSAIVLVATFWIASRADTPEIVWSWSFVPSPTNDNVETVLGVPDLNGDGYPDALAACEDKTVRAISGHSSGAATLIWTYGGLDEKPVGDRTLHLFRDRSGDGIPEILYTTGAADHSVHLIRSQDGVELWSFDVLGAATGCTGPAPVTVHMAVEAGDLDGDDVPDVAAAVGSPCNRIIALSGKTGSLLWQYLGGDGFWSVAAPGDLNLDGVSDVLAGCGSNTGADTRFLLLDGRVSPPGSRVVWEYSAGRLVSAITTVQDFTGDGVEDAVGGSWGRTLFAINSASRGTVTTPAWTQSVSGGTGWVSHALRMPDIDGDCVDEVAVGAWTPQAYVLSGRTGAVIWSQPVWTGSPYGYAASLIPDVTGDLQWDFIVGGQQVSGSPGPGFLNVFSGADGVKLWEWPSPKNVRTVSYTADIDDDGLPDVIAGLQDAATVYAFSGRNTGACVRPTAEVAGLRADRLDPARIRITWSASADVCHGDYRVYGVPSNVAGCFARLVDITDQDEDGDGTNTTWSGPGEFLGYLVLDESPGGAKGPLGHFRR